MKTICHVKQYKTNNREFKFKYELLFTYDKWAIENLLCQKLSLSSMTLGL